MAVDPYAMCPCGSGKKLKFCCSDLVGEIEKIHRMIEGEQPRAALRHVEQTLATHPGRASLLDLKATLELSLGEMDAARETVDEICRHASPTAPRPTPAEALLLAEDRASRARRSTRCSGRWRWSSATCRCACSRRSAPSAARCWKPATSWRAQAHLWLHAALAPKDDTRSREVLAALNHYSGLPLLLRDQLRFRPWPQDAPWKAEAEQAIAPGRPRQVAAGRRSHRSLGPQVRRRSDAGIQPRTAWAAGWPTTARSSPACTPTPSSMCRSTMPSRPRRSPRLLDPDLKEPRLDSVDSDVRDSTTSTRWSRSFSSDRRVQAFEMDPAAFASAISRGRDTRTCCSIGRCRESGVGLTRERCRAWPAILAIYGRQTDRPERLELTIDKGPAFDAIDRDAQGNRRRRARRVDRRKSRSAPFRRPSRRSIGAGTCRAIRRPTSAAD